MVGDVKVYSYSLDRIKQAIIEDEEDPNILENLSLATTIKYFNGGAWAKVVGATLEIKSQRTYTQRPEDCE